MLLRKSIHKLLYCEEITQRKFVILDLVKSYIMLDNIVTKFFSIDCFVVTFNISNGHPMIFTVLSLRLTVLSLLSHSQSCLVSSIHCLVSYLPFTVLSRFSHSMSRISLSLSYLVSLSPSCFVSAFHCLALSLPFSVLYRLSFSLFCLVTPIP